MNDIEARLFAWCEGDLPVSFYDAWQVLRSLRHQQILPASTLALLAQLHDATVSTPGAKNVLAEFLRDYLSKDHKQRTKGEHLLTLKDHNRTVRTAAGKELHVQLPNRRHHDLEWRLEEVVGPLVVQKHQTTLAQAPTVDLLVRVKKAGTGHVVLKEYDVAAKKEHSRAKKLSAKNFRLKIIVE